MLYLTCTTITSIDLAQYGVSLAKDWISVECGSKKVYKMYMLRAALLIMAFYQNAHTFCWLTRN